MFACHTQPPNHPQTHTHTRTHTHRHRHTSAPRPPLTIADHPGRQHRYLSLAQFADRDHVEGLCHKLVPPVFEGHLLTRTGLGILGIAIDAELVEGGRGGGRGRGGGGGEERRKEGEEGRRVGAK